MTEVTRPITAALFDMDGVIFEGENFWLDLHRRYGTEKEAWELADRYMKTDYQRLSDITVRELWIGKPESTFLELVEGRRYSAGARELIPFLRQRGVRTAIVSSGPLQLAQRAQRELGFDRVRANGVRFEDGLLAGAVDVQVHDNDKVSAGLEVIADLGGTPPSTLYVGDTDSDLELARAVGVAVAYDTRSAALAAACGRVLQKGELGRVRELLEV